MTTFICFLGGLVLGILGMYFFHVMKIGQIVQDAEADVVRKVAAEKEKLSALFNKVKSVGATVKSDVEEV
jgi:hypothetical protein